MIDTHTLLTVLATAAATLVAIGLASHFGLLAAGQNAVAQIELKTEADALHLVARAVTFLGSTKQLDDRIAAAQAELASATSAKAARAQMTQQIMTVVQSIAAASAPAAPAAAPTSTAAQS